MRKYAKIRLAAALTLAVVLSACGSSPTGPADPAEPAAGDGTAAVAAISAQLEGLDLQARRAKLIELAQAEGGEVSFYTSFIPDHITPVLEAFEEQTGITVQMYRASSSDVTRRLMEESGADRVGADVTNTNGSEKAQLVGEDLLATFETPYAEQLAEGSVWPNGIGVYRVMRFPLWNTNRLTPDQYPTTWEDVFENFPGELVLDPTDWEWFATLTQVYLMGEKGMTEEEAIAYWTEVAKGSVLISGHTLGTQLVITGEYAITAATYPHLFPPQGAPVEWEPAMFPVIETNNAVSILNTTTRPASALLLVEFFVSDAQTMLYDIGSYTPTNVTMPSAWPAEYDDLVITVDPALFTDETLATHWQDLYEQVLMGGTPGQ